MEKLVAALALAFVATVQAAPIPDRSQEQLEDRELLVYLPGTDFTRDFLAARHPELRALGPDRDGLYHYLLAPESADRIDEIRDTISALGGTLGKVMPSPRLQAAYKQQLLAERMGQPDVLGLIVRYRNLAKRKQALEATTLEPSEMARIERITGKALVSSRSMYGEQFVARLAQPVDLIEGEAVAARLAMDPAVERVMLDTAASAQLTPNDEYFNLQWSLGTSSGGIRATQAWDITQGSRSVVVAVVDTGILPGHPEFAGRFAPGVDFISSSTTSNDGDGRDGDPTDAGSFGAADACGGTAVNSSWHGSHVAGIIAANANNGIGIAGIDWNARILTARALGRCGRGSSSDIADAIAWSAGLSVPGLPANANPARIINASLSGASDSCGPYTEVLINIADRGAVLVAAAGNDNGNALSYVPASCALSLTVSATGPTGEKASYSNYSAALEVSAPGGDPFLRSQSADGILSTMSSATGAPNDTYNLNYKSGTSQATPHVAGVAALMLSVAPNLTLAQIRDTITKTARPYPAGTRCANVGDCGPGILDAPNAVNRARSIANSRNNYSALWWRSSESGWGVNFAQQGNIVFGTWFTYDAANNPVWYVMPNMSRVTDDYFEGPIYQTTGVPLHQINNAQARIGIAQVGTAGVQFFNANKGFLFANLGGAAIFKQITVQEFGPATTCEFTTGSRAGATNFSDLWWKPSESGWGINFAQQGDIIFATWFTYANDNSAIWLVSDGLRRTSGNTFSGPVYLTTGKRPQDIQGTTSILTVGSAGTMTVSFSDGEHGTMSYTIAGTSGTKQIERQTWSSPLTTCR